MSAEPFEIHLTIWRENDHTLVVRDDLGSPCETRGPTLDHALQFWLDERRRMGSELRKRLADISWDESAFGLTAPVEEGTP